jgi:exodeoxyribonuclease V beta subunit
VDVQELDAEKIRQFYVACTRAKRRLYLPVALQEDFKEPKAGTASCMELYLQKTTLNDVVGGKITMCHLVEDVSLTPLHFPQETPRAPLTFLPLAYKPNSFYLQSFTQLNDKGLNLYAAKEKEVLPTGIESGLLFHELLENYVPTGRCEGFSLEATTLEGHEEEVHKILEQALNVQIDGFSLADVDPSRLAVEVLFCAHEEKNRFLRGSIDLFFEHNNKYYLVDWKSNALKNYTKEAMQLEVEEHGYNLQAEIYTAACKRYLGDKADQFGGFYFVFLRGLHEDGVLRYG